MYIKNDYPKNLLIELFGEDEYEKNWKYCDKFDIDTTLRYILIKQCNKYIYDILLLKYTTNISYNQLCEMYNISKPTVILHIKKAKEILCQPKNKALIQIGIIKQEKEIIKEEYYKLGYDNGFNTGYTNGYKQAEEDIDILSSDIRIEKLNLSLRAFKVLKKNNINTVNDIVAIGKIGLKRIYNIGDTIYKEICDALQNECEIFLEE